jgi:hypothetical protein
MTIACMRHAGVLRQLMTKQGLCVVRRNMQNAFYRQSAFRGGWVWDRHSGCAIVRRWLGPGWIANML